MACVESFIAPFKAQVWRSLLARGHAVDGGLQGVGLLTDCKAALATARSDLLGDLAIPLLDGVDDLHGALSDLIANLLNLRHDTVDGLLDLSHRAIQVGCQRVDGLPVTLDGGHQQFSTVVIVDKVRDGT